MDNIIIQAMNHYGYFSIMIFVVLENILPFIPSELVLTFAGFMTTQTQMTVTGVIAGATLLSILGSFGLYGVGRFISEEKLASLVDTKLGKLLGFKQEHLR
jgi:membrane protein DedA with SNARE-associated domain